MFVYAGHTHTPRLLPPLPLRPCPAPLYIALLILIENKCSISCGGQKAVDCIAWRGHQGVWPAVVGGGATGAGRGQKFSKMQIIKWQPIKYANELCGVARTHTPRETGQTLGMGMRGTDIGAACTTDRQRRHIWPACWGVRQGERQSALCLWRFIY